MPLSIPATTATKANFADALKSFVDGLEVSVANAQATADAANTLAGQKFTKPAGGIAASDLADGAAVKTDGGILRDDVLTQAMYDALGTKALTTRYNIVSPELYALLFPAP